MENNETMNVTDVVEDSVKDETTDLTIINLDPEESSSNKAGMVVLGTLAVIGTVTVAKTGYKLGKKGINWISEKVKGLKKSKTEESDDEVIDGSYEECEEETE